MRTSTDPVTAARLEVLATAVTLAEQAHRRMADLYGTDAPSRELAIAAVLHQADSCWRLEWAAGEGTSEVAEFVTAYIRVSARSYVFDLIPADVRAKLASAVIADMSGPGDDDGQ